MGKQQTPETGGSAGLAGASTKSTAVAADHGPEGWSAGSRTRRAARAGLVLWIGALVVGTALFHAIGDGPLAAPPLDPSEWSSWADGRDPLIAVFAVLRLLVLALSWYLVGATSIGILARLLRAASLVRVADALTVPALRRMLQGALGVSLATAMVATSVTTSVAMEEVSPASPAREVSSASPAREASSAPARAAHGEVTTSTTPDPEPSFMALGEGDRVTLEHLERGRPLSLELLDRAREADAAAPDGSDTGPDDDPGGPEARSARPGVAVPVAVEEHVVVAGESFWTIAEDVLHERLERAASESETAAYWERLVEVNRDRLVDDGNPDLIFPGQALVVPPTTATGPGAG